MTQWFSSDLHIGHANIIRYCNRPFSDVDDMNGRLVARWNQIVHPDDTVWVLGDVAMGRLDDSLAVVSRLFGKLNLLTGNHDRCWPALGPKSDGWEERYLAAGFSDIHHGEIDIEVIGDSGRRLTVRSCHFPYEGDSQDLDRYPGARPDDDGRWLLHGHVHDVWRQRGRMINVGLDAWGGEPVAADTLIDLVESGEARLDPLPWTWATSGTTRVSG